MKRLLIFSIILMALVGSASAAFDPADYTYSEDFFVNSTTAQTNYQVKMILSNATDYSATSPWYTNGTTRDDWLDVAWTDTSNNLLPFWPETASYTITNSSWWINVSSIANDNTTEIRVHYGDADAAESYADGEKTFIFIDDFPGISLNGTKWTLQDAPTITVSNGILAVYHSTATWGGINSTMLFSPYNISLMALVKYGPESMFGFSNTFPVMHTGADSILFIDYLNNAESWFRTINNGVIKGTVQNNETTYFHKEQLFWISPTSAKYSRDD